jgi:hypothetical protein
MYRNSPAEPDVTVHVVALPQEGMTEQPCRAALHCCHWKLVAEGAHDAVNVVDDEICGYLTDAASEQYGMVPLGGGGGAGVAHSIAATTGAPGPTAFAV